jgi:hypothetical protein
LAESAAAAPKQQQQQQQQQQQEQQQQQQRPRLRWRRGAAPGRTSLRTFTSAATGRRASGSWSSYARTKRRWTALRQWSLSARATVRRRAHYQPKEEVPPLPGARRSSGRGSALGGTTPR